MKRRWIALLLTLSMCTGLLGGCGEDDDALVTGEGDGGEVTAENGDGAEGGGSASPVRNLEGASTRLQVSRTTGEMTITRSPFGNKSMGADGTWTIFVYLCGADLESENGMATGDLQEMLDANASDQVHFVVQTGGANSWDNSVVDAGKIQRFVVEGNDLKEVYSESRRSMADVSTLTDFLRWGISEYPAEHMGVVFWDHGSGSINGVCFDETDHDNSLALRDLDNAFLSITDTMTDRFEFIGFDACLMGTIESANILAPYARYMIGSEEIEPGYGWDYEEIGNYLAENPGADGTEIGKVVCDSFYAMCEEIGSEDMATLSVIDLDKVDDILISFNTFAKDIYEAGEGASELADMVRSIESSDNFGGNNRSEGYTNMVDLGGLVSGCSAYSSSAQSVISAIDDAVVYKRVGSDHKSSCGLSTYYPLSLQGSMEMKIFGDICVSPYYLSFVERQSYGSVYDTGDSSGYSIDEENTYYDEEEGIFYFEEEGVLFAYDENDGSYYYYDEDEDEWYELDEDSEEGSYIDDEDYYYDEEEGIFYFVEDGVTYAYDENEGEYYYYDEDDDDWYVVDDSEGSDDSYAYSDDYWYDDDDMWTFGWDECYYDEDSGCYRSKSVQDDRFDYADEFEVTGESKKITFSQKPGLDDEGTLSFTLNAKGIDNAALVYGYVYEYIENENDLLLLGETYDIYGDWETGHFEDGFDGYWLSLPDGQNLATYIVDYDEDYIIYTSPVEVNGVETNLRLRQNLDDWSVTIEGIWNGIDENGMAARDVRKLNAGDEIVPVYTSINADTEEESVYYGGAYTYEGDNEIVYGWLDAADYLYAFCIDDIYGDYYMSDFVTFNVDENGDLWFYEE